MASSKSCFVICAIGIAGSAERKQADLVLNYIIRPVARDAGYEVARADVAARSGMITVDTINALLDSELVIADLSFLNPNVFYELGLRHSTKRPTIHIADSSTKLPFDNADHRAVFFDVGDWHSHEEARKELARQIHACETNDVTNPVTIARAHRNDAYLSQVLDAVGGFLRQLEARIDQLTDEPPPGHVTREAHREITQRHKTEILEIVQAIRQRVDQRHGSHDVRSLPQVGDVLRRLSAIEGIILTGNATFYQSHAPN